MEFNKEQVDSFLSVLSSFISSKVSEEINYRDCDGTWMGGSVSEDSLKESLYELFNIKED